MATKKQQRRKYQRALGRGRVHEGYEPKPADTKRERPRQRSGSRGVQPPSYRRAAKRALIMSALLFVAVLMLPLGGKPSPAGAVLQAAVFFAWLTPLGYFMDSFLYRRAVKRSNAADVDRSSGG